MESKETSKLNKNIDKLCPGITKMRIVAAFTKSIEDNADIFDVHKDSISSGAFDINTETEEDSDTDEALGSEIFSPTKMKINNDGMQRFLFKVCYLKHQE